MITGIHAIVFSPDAGKVRDFFADVHLSRGLASLRASHGIGDEGGWQRRG